jgi:hypothetical protein
MLCRNPLARSREEHEVVRQNAEVALALAGSLRPAAQRRVEPLLVPRERAFRVPATE